MSEYEIEILSKIENLIMTKNLSNEFLVENFKLSSQYLGLKTIKEYAKQNKVSVQSIYKSKKYIELIDTKFVIDNE